MQGTCHSFQNVIYDYRNLINTFFCISIRWERECLLRNDGHSNRRTNITRLIITFRYYANASNNIENIFKTKQLLGSPSIFNVQVVP
jgi:hypothetical protein